MKTEKITAYRDTDYMFSSALARAKEGGIMGKEALYRLIDAPSAESLLSEFGYLPPLKEALSRGERDRLLDERVSESFDEIEAALPSFDGEWVSAVTPLRYPYDCNNIKAAMKCALAGVSPDEMLFSCGTVDPESIRAAVAGSVKDDEIKPNRKSRAAGIPDHMKAAIKEAADEYASSRNPRAIDLILDRACFADMHEAAAATDIPFLVGYVRLKTDAVNILTALRILKMYGAESPIAEDILKKALLPGGEARLEGIINGGREAIREILRRSPRLECLSEALSDDVSLSDAERLIDNAVADYVIGAKRIAFGAEVPLGYLLGLELSVKNVRIALAGREAGLDGALIRERMRENYV